VLYAFSLGSFEPQVVVRGDDTKSGAFWRRRLGVTVKGDKAKVEQVAASLRDMKMECQQSGSGLGTRMQVIVDGGGHIIGWNLASSSKAERAQFEGGRYRAAHRMARVRSVANSSSRSPLGLRLSSGRRCSRKAIPLQAYGIHSQKTWRIDIDRGRMKI